MNGYHDHYHHAQSALDSHCLVGAGAGTGKTYVLTHRFANAVAVQRCDPRHILAVTFTRKAAAEMKQRIRQVLREYLYLGRCIGPESDPGNSDTWLELDAAGRNHVAQAIGLLGEAPVNTIDGFCSTIVRRFALAAGVDPEFVLVEPAASAARRDQGVARYLEAVLADPGHDLHDRLAELLGRYDYRKVRATVSALVALRRPDADAVRQWDACRRRVAEFFRGHPMLERLWPVDGEQPTNERALMVDGAVRALHGAPVPDPAHLAAICGSTTLQGNFNGIGNFAWLRDELLGYIKGPDNQAGSARAVLEAFVDLAQGCPPYLRPDELDYRGVTNKVLELLRDDQHRAAIREALGLRHILVDEYQDTDAVQQEIMYRLQGADLPGDDENGHATFDLDGPRLFVVGDPQQSIYRFRGAEVEVFARTRRDIENNGGQVLHLDRNRRSTRLLIDFFNHLFTDRDGQQGVFSRHAGAAPADYEPRYERLAPRDGAGEGDGITCHILNRRGGQEEDGEDRDLPTDEAEWIADQVQAILTGPAPRQPRDIAVLRYSVARAGALVAELDRRHIPSFVVGSRQLFDRPEVRDLLAWLRVLARPDDDLALVCCAKQPCIGLTDADLLAIRTADIVTDLEFPPTPAGAEPRWNEDDLERYGGGFTFRLRFLRFRAAHERADELNRRLQRFQACLETLRGLAGTLPVARLAEKIVATTGMRRTWAGWRRTGEVGRSREAELILANLEQVLDRFRAAAGDTADIAAALASLEAEADSPESSAEAQLVAEDDNVVRIMTIHQAKGLEFPVVFVAGIESLAGSSGGGNAVSVVDALPVVGLPEAPGSHKVQPADLLSRYAARVDTLKALAERRRLFYVAVTRAKNRLFLSGSYKPASETRKDEARTIHNCHDGASWMVIRFGMREATNWAEAGIATWDAETDAGRFLQPGEQDQGEVAREREQAEHVDPVVLPEGAWSRVTYVSPSREHAHGEADVPPFLAPEGPARQFGTSDGDPDATDHGRMVHQFFAAWDFIDATAEALIEQTARAWFGDDRTAAARQLLQACSENFSALLLDGRPLREVFAEALADGRLYREWPVLHRRPVPGDAGGMEWVSGRIDVVLRATDGQHRIFDYKTGNQPPAGYAGQLAMYQAALAEALGPAAEPAPPTVIYVEPVPSRHAE